MEYYTHVRLKNEFNAGNKATDDVARICESMGLKELVFPKLTTINNKYLFKLWILGVTAFVWFKHYLKIKKGDVLLFQHPMYGVRMSNFFISKIRNKGCKCIAIIHDLDSLRNKGVENYMVNNKTAYIADECLLKQFDAIICHNGIMHDYLVSQGFEDHKVVNLNLFDYLTDFEITPRHKETADYSLVIAGNLTRKKSSYLYDFFDNCPDNMDVYVYGIGYDTQSSYNNVHYEGAFPPDELCAKLQGDFGIVWDGTSASSCVGNTGNYLKYNNPHKLSLYLTSGIPVVVWSQSAVSSFVKENGVGIIVDSLMDIERIIKGLSSEEYNIMVDNTVRISKESRNGLYFKVAYEEAKKRCYN